MRVDKTSGTAQHDERLQHARRFVNDRRKELKLRATGKLPKGYRCDTLLCPLAKALEAVGVMRVNYGDGKVILYGMEGQVLEWDDPETAQFLSDFDAGEYPELVIVPKPLRRIGRAKD